MKIGDKVRFLNEVGGGTVTGFPKKGVVTVCNEDGFDIPMLERECVVIDTDDYNIAKVHTETPAPKKKEKRQAGSVLQDADEEEYEPADKPVTFKAKPVERREGELLNAKLAFLPMNEKEISTTRFEAYFINDSNYFVDFCYLTAEGNAWRMRFRGTAEPNTKVFMEEFGHEDLNEMEHVCLQLYAYKEEKSFRLKPALSVQIRIDGTKFYKINTFGPTDFFEEPALLYDVVTNDKAARTIFIDAEEMKEALLQKQHEDHPQPVRQHKTKKENGPLEIDLHATELLETTAGMKAGEILEYQLGVFRRTMDENKGQKGKKIIFIHGKGEGVLRQALLKELRTKYRSCSYQDASFREYGFGATMVTIH